MEVVNLGQLRRFLRERPMRVPLFDRQRMVGEVLCLEPEQQETRHALDVSDALYLIIEGKARLRAGPLIEDLETLDSVMVPPGVEHTLTNPGPERLVALVIVAPKPTRAGEQRPPREDRPVHSEFGRTEDDRPPREYPPRSPSTRFAGPPRAGAGRPFTPRRPVAEGDDERRTARPSGPRPFAAGRRPAGPPPRGRSFRPAGADDSAGPNWSPPRAPRPYGAGRPATGAGRAPTRAGGGSPRPYGAGRPSPSGGGFRRPAGESGSDERPARPARPAGARPYGAGRPPAGGGNRRGPAGGGSRGPANRGGAPKANPGRPTGRPGPGRSGPRTSGPRRAP